MSVELMDQHTPDRSLQQRREALLLANHVRRWRAERKVEIKARRTSVSALIALPAQEIETMKILDLILRAPKVGRVKAMRMLNRAGIAPSKTVGGLSDRQRAELLSLLGMIGA